MRETRIISYALAKTSPHKCIVHTSITEGIGIYIVGSLTNNQTKDSLLKIASLFNKTGFSLSGKKIVIDITFCERLTPFELEKIDSRTLDLPIALSLLLVSEQLHLDTPIFATGELLLNGKINGAILATQRGICFHDTLQSLIESLTKI